MTKSNTPAPDHGANRLVAPSAASLTLASTTPTVTDLTRLIELLRKIAADRAADERLPKKERDQWVRQVEIFSVAELNAILIDPQYENARDRLLGKLFETVSACFIAARMKENRSKNAKAEAAKNALTRIVVEEAEKQKVWRERSMDDPQVCSRVAGLIEKSVSEKIKAKAWLLSKRHKGLIAAEQPVKSRRAIEMILRRQRLSTARTIDRT